MSRLEEEKTNLLNLNKILKRKNLTPDRVKRLRRLIKEKETTIRNLEKIR